MNESHEQVVLKNGSGIRGESEESDVGITTFVYFYVF